MGNTAKEIELKENNNFEKWLKEKAAPIVKDVQSGKRKGTPLREAYERGLRKIAEFESLEQK